MANYLPTRESELVAWSGNFAQVIGSDPLLYGLDLGQASAYTAAQEAFAALFASAQGNGTRTPAVIQSKKQAKAALIALTRELVNICQSWPGMTNEKRSLLGVTIRDVEPTPVPVPTTAPVIEVLGKWAQVIKIRLRDADSTRRGRPDGVVGATLFTFVGDQPPADISGWKFEGNVKDTVVELEFAPTVPPGSKVWITGFWRNNRDESGPATMPIYDWTANGGVNLAA